MSKSTPGPWCTRQGSTQMCADDMTTVAAVYTRDPAGHWWIFSPADTHGDRSADARLIAAAPDLIEALRPFSALLAEHHNDLPDDRPIFGINGAVITAGDLRRARAAIAKAGAA